MASAHTKDEEIEQLNRRIQALGAEISAASRRSESAYKPERSLSPYNTPPTLRPFGSSAKPAAPPLQQGLPAITPRRTKRKEIEARRYNGKESVTEYLTQFELIAQRNDWDDEEMATSLLCALDGPARSLLSELDDTCYNGYDTIRDLLIKRFGPVRHTEVHEQALQEIRLSRGQSIRELTQRSFVSADWHIRTSTRPHELD